MRASVGSTRDARGSGGYGAKTPVLTPTGRAAERGARNRRTSRMPPSATKPTSNRLPNDSDSPRCDINAASPSPAAIPAIGPSQRDMPDGAGATGAGGVAARGAAALGCAGITGSDAAPLAAGALGAD